MGAGPIMPMHGKRTNKDYVLQGWNAALAGFRAEQCPYYATSSAANNWLKGFSS